MLQEIIRWVVPTNGSLRVRYAKITQPPPLRDAMSLLKSSRILSEATIPILYGENTFMFDQIVESDLPIFLQNIRDRSLRCLRRVSIYWAYGADLRVGLDLLVGCESLRSLEIDTRNKPLTKKQQRQHEPILKCFRLETFSIKSTSNPSVDAVVSSNGTSASYELWKRMKTEFEV
jgi:hypothetical protein